MSFVFLCFCLHIVSFSAFFRERERESHSVFLFKVCKCAELVFRFCLIQCVVADMGERKPEKREKNNAHTGYICKGQLCE